MKWFLRIETSVYFKQTNVSNYRSHGRGKYKYTLLRYQKIVSFPNCNNREKPKNSINKYHPRIMVNASYHFVAVVECGLGTNDLRSIATDAVANASHVIRLMQFRSLSEKRFLCLLYFFDTRNSSLISLINYSCYPH